MAPSRFASDAKEINQLENRGYADNGVSQVQRSGRTLMQRNFGVELDPVKEVNHCIGSKTALAILPATLSTLGDITLMTVPGYPVAGTHTKYYGRQRLQLAFDARKEVSSPISPAFRRNVRQKAKLLVICYRNSPTARLPRASSTSK